MSVSPVPPPPSDLVVEKWWLLSRALWCDGIVTRRVEFDPIFREVEVGKLRIEGVEVNGYVSMCRN